MKICPACSQSYIDDTLNYCLSDGSPLVFPPSAGEVETVVLPARFAPVKSAPGRPGVSPVFAYLAIGLLALIAGGALVAWFQVNTRPSGTTSSPDAAYNSNSPIEGLPKGTANTTPPKSRNQDSVAPVSLGQEQREIESSLNAWVETLESKDLEGHMGHYDDTLDTYFRKSKADKSFVRADYVRLFGKYASFKIQVSNLRIDIQPDGNRATSTFDSTFDFDGRIKHSGSVRSEIRWKKIERIWKITSQRDVKTN